MLVVGGLFKVTLFAFIVDTYDDIRSSLLRAPINPVRRPKLVTCPEGGGLNGVAEDRSVTSS